MFSILIIGTIIYSIAQARNLKVIFDSSLSLPLFHTLENLVLLIEHVKHFSHLYLSLYPYYGYPSLSHSYLSTQLL